MATPRKRDFKKKNGPEVKDEEEKWLPIPKVSRTVPFGYEVDPNDDKVLLPIKKELDALEKAAIFLNDYSMRDVALWVAQETGRYISTEGLRKRLRRDRQRRKKLRAVEYYARLYKEAIETAKRLEGKTGTATTHYIGTVDSIENDGASGAET